jgi:DNA-binding transcriptional MerR regulator
LGVSAQTIRYHARRAGLPFSVTPGGHRRYDIDEVRAVLERNNQGRFHETAVFPPAGQRLVFDADETATELNESAALLHAATAGADERSAVGDDEHLPHDDFMDGFAVPGIARYPQEAHGVGAGA